MNNKNDHGLDNKINHKGEGNHAISAKDLTQTIPNHIQIDGTEQYKAELSLQKEHDPSVFEKMGAIATEAYNFFFPEAHANAAHLDNKDDHKHPLTVDDVMDKFVDKDSGVLQEAPPYHEEHHEQHKPNQKHLVQNEGDIHFDDGSAKYPLGLVEAGFLTHGLNNQFLQN